MKSLNDQYVDLILEDILREFLEWLIHSPMSTTEFNDELIKQFLAQRNSVTKESLLP